MHSELGYYARSFNSGLNDGIASLNQVLMQQLTENCDDTKLSYHHLPAAI